MPISYNPKIELLTPNDLANILRISKAGVYRLVDKRQIPFHKVMGSLRFNTQDVLSYLEQNRIEPIGLK
ncbi:MAG: helix-turn-helix domain-containing protein [bacterium]|nr:helix-turn-helix domain-containing protein [bacterium]